MTHNQFRTGTSSASSTIPIIAATIFDFGFFCCDEMNDLPGKPHRAVQNGTYNYTGRQSIPLYIKIIPSALMMTTTTTKARERQTNFCFLTIFIRYHHET